MLIILSEDMEAVTAQVFIRVEGTPVADLAHVFSRHAVAASYQLEARFQTTWQSLSTRMG